MTCRSELSICRSSVFPLLLRQFIIQVFQARSEVRKLIEEYLSDLIDNLDFRLGSFFLEIPHVEILDWYSIVRPGPSGLIVRFNRIAFQVFSTYMLKSTVLIGRSTSVSIQGGIQLL